MAPPDQTLALSLSADALRLWESQRLAEAEQRYREALAVSDPSHEATPDIHGAYAGVLTGLNRLADAGRHYETALQLALQARSGEDHPSVLVARYFLGEHYLRTGEPESARKVVAPSLAASQGPLGWIVEAEALFQCGGTDDARAAAERALSLAGTDDQRERIRARFAELLAGDAL
jgi:tetratricopeptide (TPR) repeat protein